MSQQSRLAEFIQEMKDCHTLNCEWTHEEWCGYVDQWTDPSTGYIVSGGVRPTRLHP